MPIKALFNIKLCLFCLLLVFNSPDTYAAIDRLRATWRSDPATTMVIGWDQTSGGRPTFYYDDQDHGQNWAAYQFLTPPSWANRDKGMNNVFVRLEDLKPNTVYYFIVKDSEGISQRYSFKTAPDNPSVRLSIIAGSDSRNHRMARMDANRLVGKLRPHCVMFGGDMTGGDTAEEWINWMDDWQLTFGSDGRIFPVIAARGNHESSNDVLVNLFDVPNPAVFYSLTLGGDLLRIYTLNTQIPGGGNQKEWLARDLQTSQNVTWRMAQYHQAIRPHNSDKKERPELILQWATLFHKYKVNLVMESDAHVVKTTWPIRPGVGPNSAEGFVRDDVNGTIYMGEGGWGAPLRAANDPKPWTRSYGRFNQFKWIFVDEGKIEVRTIKTEGSNRVAEVAHDNVFEPPYGLVIWSPEEGDVVRIVNPNPRQDYVPAGPAVVKHNPPTNTGKPEVRELDAEGKLHIEYTLTELSDVELILIKQAAMQEVARLDYPNQQPGKHQKALELGRAPAGKYLLLVKANGQLNNRFGVLIR